MPPYLFTDGGAVGLITAAGEVGTAEEDGGLVAGAVDCAGGAEVDGEDAGAGAFPQALIRMDESSTTIARINNHFLN